MIHYVTDIIDIAHRVHGDNPCNSLHGHTIHVQRKVKEQYVKGLDDSFRNLVMLLNNKFLIDIHDPFVNGVLDGADIIDNTIHLSKHYNKEILSLKDVYINNVLCGYLIDVNHWSDNDPKKQFYGSFVLTPYNPSIFNITKMLYECVQKDVIYVTCAVHPRLTETFPHK